MMYDDQDAQLVIARSVVDPERKTPERVAAQVTLHDRPSVGRSLDLGDRRFKLSEKSVAKTRGPSLIKLDGLDQLGLRLGVIDQSHSKARWAARMISS